MRFREKISDRERIVIPSKLRHSLGLEAGDEIVLCEHNGALLILSLKQAIQQIQDCAEKRVPNELNLVEELLAMRCADVQQEDDMFNPSQYGDV